MEKKKIFENPEAIVVNFVDDVILTSGPGDPEGQSYDDWGNGGN